MIEIAPDAAVDLFGYCRHHAISGRYLTRARRSGEPKQAETAGPALHGNGMPSMPSDTAALALHDIRDNGKYAEDFVAGLSLEEFKRDRKTFYAVTRALEIISEAARRLSPRCSPPPELPWRAIVALAMSTGTITTMSRKTTFWRPLHESLPALLTAIAEEIERPAFG